jgi:outer membrane receptor protein involved in Fe transport
MNSNARRAERIIRFIALAAALMAAKHTVAQTVNGSILGTVRDQAGAVIPNASISVKSLETGAERSATTDGLGAYNILSVPAGSYDVTASVPGFRTEVRRGITMTVGAVLRVDLALNVGAISDKVEVTGEAPQVDTTTSTMSGLVAEGVIRELPLNGRDWLQLTVLQPGALIVVSTNQQSSPGTGLGTKMSISGGRPTQNVFRIDGLVVNDQGNDSPGSALGVNMGVDAIREFSVLTNAYSAEYGRSSGGVVNAITKSGTNGIHGTAFEFLRNSALDARNFFDLNRVPPFRRNQFGGSVGGPIKKDKLFFFANYEGLRQFLSQSIVAQTLSPNARNGLICANPPACTSTTQITINPNLKPYLPLYPQPNGAIQGDTGQYLIGGGTTGDENYVTGRVDYQLSARTSLFGSYTFDNANKLTPDAFVEKQTGTHTRSNRVMVTLQHSFTPTVINTIRTGFQRSIEFSGLDTNPASPLLTDLSLGFVPGRTMGMFTVSGLNTPGGIGSTGGDKYWYTTPQLSDDLAWVRGRNNIRIGFSVEAIRHNPYSPSAPNGVWQFGSVSDFLTGNNAQQFSADFPGTNLYRGFREKIFGVYFQDDLRIRPNLTLNLGARYEPTTTIKEVNNLIAVLPTLDAANPRLGNGFYKNPTLRNVSPRVGFSWDPFGNGKTAVRSGFGVFDVPILVNLFHLRALRSAPFFKAGNLVNPPVSSYPNGAFPLLGPSAFRAYWVQPNPPVAYKMQWNLNIQRQLTNSLSLMAGYVGAKGVHMPDGSDDGDMVPPGLVKTAPDGNLLFPSTRPYLRINPNYSQVQTTRWDGFSIYHSLQVNLVQRLSHGFTFQAVYAYSKSIDNGGIEYSNVEIAGQMDNPWWFDTNLQKGVSDFNIPQHLSLNFVWDAPSPHSGMAVTRFLLSGWELSGIFTTQSGRPFSIRIPSDQAGTGSNQVGRNGGGQRPDFNPSGGPGCTVGAVNAGVPANYIRVECFSFPRPGELGNLGRNTFRAPKLEDFDFSVFKNHNLVGEKLKVQFRAESFNLFNRPNFTNGGQPFTPFNSNGQPVLANTRLVGTVTTSRQIQFGLKLLF